MTDKDRIKLADAMGWEPDMGGWWPPEGDEMHGALMDEDYLPDPFTDANDDYAVLEWAKKVWQGKYGHYGHWNQFARALWWRWDEYNVVVPYQIGDYARAALKVIDH